MFNINLTKMRKIVDFSCKKFYSKQNTLVLGRKMQHLFENIVITDVPTAGSVFTDVGTVRNITEREAYGLIFSSTGRIEYYHEGRTYVTDSQHFLLAPKHASYSLKGIERDVSFVVNFECNLALTDFYSLPVLNRSMIQDAERAVSLYRAQSTGWRTQALELLYRILSQFCKPYSHGALPDHLTRAIAYFYEHYADATLTNAQVASHCGISQNYLQKEFIKRLSTSPKHFLQGVRIEKAKHLLSSTLLNVSEVGSAVGYASLYHFSRVFKQESGLSPTDYRKLQQSLVL